MNYTEVDTLKIKLRELDVSKLRELLTACLVPLTPRKLYRIRSGKCKECKTDIPSKSLRFCTDCNDQYLLAIYEVLHEEPTNE